MADSIRREKVKHHIEAAREWLGSASGALEQREDIKSELDIMLAEAELTRAREMKNSSEGDKGLRRAKFFRQVMRLAPLAAALTIAALWLRFSAVTPPVKPIPPEPPVVAKPKIPQGAKQTKTEQQAPAAKEKPGYTAEPPRGEGEKTEGQPSAPAPAKITEGKQPPDRGENAESAENNGVAQPKSGPGMIPDSSIQQMMLDAAKMLRQTK